MDLLISAGFLLVAFYLLSLSSDLLIHAASGLGRQLGLKDYLIGSLIVGIGTSLPELVTSVAAIDLRAPAMVAPNIYGTIIANIGAGLGLAVVGLHVLVTREGKTRLVDWRHPYQGGVLHFPGSDNRFLDTSLFFAVFSIILSYFLCRDGTFSRMDALWFFLGYLAFVISELTKHNRSNLDDPDETDLAAQAPAHIKENKRWTIFKRLIWIGAIVLLIIEFSSVKAYVDKIETGLDYTVLSVLSIPIYVGLLGFLVILISLRYQWATRQQESFDHHMETTLAKWPKWLLSLCLITSLVVLFLSGEFIVAVIIEGANALGIGAPILAGSVIAVGTSLPDIIVAIKIARKGRHRLLIGHIIQSNVFDVFLVMAICGFIQPLPTGTGPTTLSILFAAGVTIGLSVMTRNKKITLPKGILLFLALLIFLVTIYY